MLQRNIKLVHVSMLFLIIFTGIALTSSKNFSKVNAAEKATTAVSLKQVECLATAIFYEAGHEPELGQIAVARVVMNRVIHGGFANTPCDVVYESRWIPTGDNKKRRLCQFSWVCDPSLKAEMNQTRFQQAERIALEVLTRNAWNDIIPENVLFFHSVVVEPNWNLDKYMVIGNHVFYSKEIKKSTKYSEI